MFRKTEVVGISKEGFSEAVREALKTLKEEGVEVYWFEVIEQRGALKGDEIEFQVTLRVGSK